MSEDNGAEKAGLNNLLKEITNGILEEEEGKRFKLRVEEVDTGIFVSPIAAVEVMKSPAYKEDMKENTGMLIDMKVKEVVKGLLDRLVIRVQINERREVLIKNKGVHEAEILESDLKGIKIEKEREKILEEKSNRISEVVKAALERIMSGEDEDFKRGLKSKSPSLALKSLPPPSLSLGISLPLLPLTSHIPVFRNYCSRIPISLFSYFFLLRRVSTYGKFIYTSIKYTWRFK